MATFSITTFNARWGLGVDDVPFDLPGVVGAFDTDVISLQEVWDPAVGSGGVRRAAEALGYEVHEVPLAPSTIEPSPQITADPSVARGTWGVALLSRLPVRRVRTVDLGRLVERWDVADRHAIIAEVEVGDVAVSITALHLSFVLPNAAAQLRRLSGYLPVARPSVIAGDCNLWGPVAAAVVDRHRRTVRGRTWPAHRPHSQLDHLLATPDLELVDGQVLRPVGSDHRPVTAVLRVRRSPTPAPGEGAPGGA